MKTIGNIVWFICGGFLAALMWLMSGLICCVTVVGIPLGKQCFKFARLSAAPFGKDIRFGGGAQYSVDNPARLGERSLLRRDGRCLLLHNNRHPARTPVFQIRKARIHAFRLRGG